MDMAVYMQKRRAARREALIWLAGSRCVLCGSDENLEFDHINYETKLFNLSGRSLDTGWSKVYKEYLKCQLLCKQCHQHKTVHKDNRTGGGWNKILDPQHGTWAMYGNYRCRCTECKLWKKNYRAGKVDARNKMTSGQ